MNKKIDLGVSEWKTLVANDLDGNSFEGRMMHSLACIPALVHHDRKTQSTGVKYQDLLDETRANYQTLKADLIQLHHQTSSAQALCDDEHPQMGSVKCLHAYFQRVQGLGFTTAILLNCVLRNLGSEDSGLELESESTSFSKEILVLAESASRYRPLASSYIVLSLILAWIGTTDQVTRRSIEKAIADYSKDFPAVRLVPTAEEMHDLQHHLLGPDMTSTA